MQGLKFREWREVGAGGTGAGLGSTGGGKGLGWEEPVSTAVFHPPEVMGERF